MTFAPELLDQLLEDYTRPEDMLGPGGIFDQLKKALAERALGAELAQHLTEEATQPAPPRNHRNGTTPKTVQTDTSALRLAVPRDRAGTFEPQLVKKHQRRLAGFDEKVISWYARGLTVREMQAHLTELYGVEVSPSLISTVTDAVLEEVTAWQQRPLISLYPVVFFDALRVKIRDPEAITSVFPHATIQTCIVHLLRHSLNFVTWKDRTAVAGALKAIYQALDAAAAERELDSFAAGSWGQKYPPIAAAWRRHWTQVIPFFAHPVEIRRVLYTTNAIESLHMQLRKALKTRGHFPNDEAALKLLYLVLRNTMNRWKQAPAHWKTAMNQFAILYPDRFISEG